MPKKDYDWEGGATLEEHSKKKHSILATYFKQYLITRCKFPQQEKFRLAIVDGFSGAGLYSCGSLGSPLIFIQTLSETAAEINVSRAAQGMRPIHIECLLIANDYNKVAISQLQKNIAPFLVLANESPTNLRIETEFFNGKFESIYPDIKRRLIAAKCRNVLFNLDQCGYSHVTSSLIKDAISTWKSTEVILTFMIGSLLAYLSPDKAKSGVPLEREMQEQIDDLLVKNHLNKNQWLGKAERIAFECLKNCAPYVSPFSINNPNGWEYWLMHFASSYRARQVFNDVLHQDNASQAHFGRAGLNMLAYNPNDEGSLYLFDNESRRDAKEALYDDIPRFVAESGDAIQIQEFYAAAYNETPAHSDDIHEMIIENPDMEVLTDNGGQRRLANTIKPEDTLRLKSQKSMFFMFNNYDNNK